MLYEAKDKCEIAERIINLLDDRFPNTSVRDAAEIIGISYNTLYTLISYSRKKGCAGGFNTLTLVALCKAMNVSADYILFGVEHE